MLPTSHISPIEVAVAPVPGGGMRDAGAAEELSATSLAEAFGRFIHSSSRLEEVYRQLREQISVLTQELAQRNAELKASLAANEGMRVALQEIVDTMPCGVLVVRADGTVATVNPECRRMLRRSAVETVLDEGVLLTTLAEPMGAECAAVLGGDLGMDAEHEFSVAEESGTRWMSLRKRGLQGAGERVLVLRDVTARHRAEEDRERGRKAMAMAETATVLAHEIRNPLASLELFAELIEADEERRMEWIENLRAGVRMLSSTVNNVLSFDGTRSLRLQPVSLTAVVESAATLLLPVAQQAKVRLEWAAEAVHAEVAGNAAGLQQVMVNLILNALRHSPIGGRVAITVRAAAGAQDWIVAECVDNGPGIANAQLGQIFEAGYSGDGATPGLGLAVCARIVRQHCGHIRAENVPTGGARFRVELPALAAEGGA